MTQGHAAPIGRRIRAHLLGGGVTRELSELEKILLDACKVALRQLEYDGDDNTAFHGAAWEALTKAFAAAEPTP